MENLNKEEFSFPDEEVKKPVVEDDGGIDVSTPHADTSETKQRTGAKISEFELMCIFMTSNGIVPWRMKKIDNIFGKLPQLRLVNASLSGVNAQNPLRLRHKTQIRIFGSHNALELEEQNCFDERFWIIL